MKMGVWIVPWFTAMASIAMIPVSSAASHGFGYAVVAMLPTTLRSAGIRPSWFKTTTRYEVSPAEYRAFAAADRGQIYVANGYKISVARDDRHGLALVDRSCCALQEWIIFRPTAPLGAEAAPADLSAVTVGEIGIGNSVASVEHRFGPSNDVALRRGQGLLRYRHHRSRDCVTLYTFDVADSRVKAISVKNAC